MKYLKAGVPLLVACVLSSVGYAASTAPHTTRSGANGVITFVGSITQPTSVPVAAAVPAQADPSTTTTVEPLAQAQPRLASDLLDYYAQYAKPGAKLVSVAYQ
ncbi:hypothetical protein [Dyella nitratireducens]|uniref:Uncharacterized protein n=1 Tax=Dyella nitratireducens TaxID=1849580 RepID=A0ABQ1FJA1_9GAMM|nr:hypothetical protein [Dyella nitratireducens]GGA17895.1 hypothetical protein GCM10010981_02090 [Dyella nitratireducens]GLQ44729.1 hypothetical protein GCM10007902_45790 [Dyella nitratireducens]